jgi:hypothetical protein
MVIVVIAAMSLGVCVLYARRRRNPKAKAPSPSSTSQPGPDGPTPSAFRETTTLVSSAPLEPVSQVAPSVRPVVMAADRKLERSSPSPSIKPSSRPERLVAAAVTKSAPASFVGEPEQKSDDDIDYGELTERLLNLAAMKRSVFRKEIQDKVVDVSPETSFERPRIVSGLSLKALMEAGN